MLVREFANEETALRPMSAWLREACAALGARGSVVDDAELCANELFANLCAHAFPEGGRHRITLTLAAVPEGVRLTLEDDGVAFDPFAQPLPLVPASLVEARAGGYGLLLVRRLARDMRYERVESGNRLTLMFTVP